MDQAERQRRIAEYLNTVLPTGGLEGAFDTGGIDPLRAEAEEAHEDVRGEWNAALDGMDRLRQGQDADPDQLDGLEAIVLPRERPAVDIIGDHFQEVPRPWTHLGTPERRKILEPAITSVGRIEIPGHPAIPYAGTGFVVGPRHILTNRHVAELFVAGGADRVRLRTETEPQVDFKREVVWSEPDPMRIERAVWIHPYWDAALLEVSGLPAGRPPLALDPVHADDLVGRELVIIGYPAFDPRSNAEVQNRVFRGVYQVKRFQPGKASGTQRIVSFGNVVDTLGHDSSTLGGNSGSVILDAETGRVVGLHFAGSYLKSNYAVPVWELARDPRVWDSGVRFWKEEARPTAEPPWAGRWGADGGVPAAPAPSAAAVAHVGTRPVGASSSERGPFVGDWFERADAATIARLYAQDPDGTRAALESVVGTAHADELVGELSGGLEGFFDPDPDPSLPVLVFLHGILGGHLADTSSTGRRVWLDPLVVATTDVGRTLALRADGVTERGPLRLGPNGYLQAVYALAVHRWRRARLDVRPFVYDWRKSIALAAEGLHAHIEAIHRAEPARKVVIVAHSMGGLVAAAYAHAHEEWEARVARAVFVGSPLGGSWAPVEAILGRWALLDALALVSGSSGESLRSMATSLPGLLEMLPDPTLFDAEAVYDVDRWPDPAPDAKTLKRAKKLRKTFLTSPILARTVGIVGTARRTIASHTVVDGVLVAGPRSAEGDGTVPVDAAAVAGLARVLVANGHPHPLMLMDDDVIRATTELARADKTGALPVYEPGAEGVAVFAEGLADAATEDRPSPDPDMAAGVRARLRAGALRASDVAWLFDPVVPPEAAAEACEPGELEEGFEVLVEGPEAFGAEAEAPLTLSGPGWVKLFRGSNALEELAEPFFTRCSRFVSALRQAGVTVSIAATYRPPERAWLMHWAWQVANRAVAPDKVPTREGIAIQWDHGDLEASVAAARAMVSAYTLKHIAALESNHTKRRAIDMKILWSGRVTLPDNDGNPVTIDAAEGDHTRNTRLHRLGWTYGVIKLVSDPPHWSQDGR